VNYLIYIIFKGAFLMKKAKFVTLAATALLAAGILTACGGNNNDTTATTEPATTETTDAVTGPTQTDATDVATLKEGLSADGSWIVFSTKDIDASGETITVDGTFTHRDAQARKLAFYEQKREGDPVVVTITARHTLTVDRLIVKSPNFDLSNMKLVGDVYVEADGFKISATEGSEEDMLPQIDGNLYFSTQAQLDAFKAMDGDLSQYVTGHIEVKSAE
jgi:hypothetical protein